MSNDVDREQLIEKLCSLFGNLNPGVISIPRIIRLKEKMMGVIYLKDYRERGYRRKLRGNKE